MKKNFYIFIIFIHTFLLSQSWLDPTYYYRKMVNIVNTGNYQTLVEYQVNINLDQSNFDFSKVKIDGSDLRITDSDGVSLLDYWIEKWDINNYASIWVKIPIIPSNTNKVIYMYYGNPNAEPIGSGFNTFVFFNGFENFIQFQYNATNPLYTPTYDGSGQAVHPSVIYIPEGWNGFKYWMCLTPYPYANSNFENPSILVSNNNIEWFEPQQGMNPIVQNHSAWNHDPDMLIIGDSLILYYNQGNSDGTIFVKRMSSKNGIIWTTPQNVDTSQWYLLSPSIVYDNNQYYMWYVRASGCLDTVPTLYRKTSFDGKKWSPEETVNFLHKGFALWHLDIQKVDNKFVMIYCAFPKYKVCDETNLYYAESTDGLNWDITTSPVLVPTAIGWDNGQIYRASFIYDGSDIRIWYSARSTSNEWHIGYTEGSLYELVKYNWDFTIGNVISNIYFPHTGRFGLSEYGDYSAPPRVMKNVQDDRYSFNVWLYDSLSLAGDFKAVLRVWDLPTSEIIFPFNNIGIGIWSGFPSFYFYHIKDNIAFSSNISRTIGWHKFSINVKESSADLLIDNILITQVDALDESNIQSFSLDGWYGGIGYFDDAYVRKYTEPEPQVFPEIGDVSLPVELSTFTIHSEKEGLRLKWITESEVNVVGFEILRSEELKDNYNVIGTYKFDETLRSTGNSNFRKVYNYLDRSVYQGKIYWYKLISVDYDGKRKIYGPIETYFGPKNLTLISNDIPESFNLFQNYPNPFNPNTFIIFDIPQNIIYPVNIVISIYNSAGQKIRDLFSGNLNYGRYRLEWDGCLDFGNAASSGLYFVVFNSTYFHSVIKIIKFK